MQDFREECSFSRLGAGVHNHALLGGSGGMPPKISLEKWPLLRRILAGFQALIQHEIPFI